MPTAIISTHHADDLLFNQYATQLVEKLASIQDTDKRVLIVHLNLENDLTYHNISSAIARVKPDHVICFDGPEPHWLLNHRKLMSVLGQSEYSFLGYTNSQKSTFLDFWALCTDKFFPAYDNLSPIESDRFYLCHNRQPYPHRIALVNSIDTSIGFVSCGNRKGPEITIDTTLEFYNQEATHRWHVNADGTPISIPYDTYTLGDISVWQQIVLDIVSDSFWVTTPNKFGNSFLSEKYYKPILGLRPFLTYGNPATYFKLRELGFQTFETDLGITVDSIVCSQESAITAINQAITYLGNMSATNRISWYNSLLPKLVYNKNRFAEHVAEQQRVLENYRV